MEFLQKLRSFVWSKHFLKHTGMIVLTYIIVVGGTMLLLDYCTNQGQRTSVPDLVGLKADVARTRVEELGLKMELLDSVYRPDLPTGTIVSQDPAPTSKSTVYVKEGRIIRVQISKKTRLVEMPSLIDKSQRFAESVLKNRGLKYRIQYKQTSEANGAVLKQLFEGSEISEGRRIPIGSTITIIVGRNEGGQPVEVPDLNGLTISEARGRLGNSLTLFLAVCDGCANAVDSSSAVIYSQSPEYMEGVMVPPGTSISVQASTSPQATPQ
jgi:eukaryotic-like serine/threonine-protein kinase